MGLKIFTRIKLPYIIRMKEVEIIHTQLPATKEFTEFNITFYPNLHSNNELYNPLYSENICFFIEVEAVTELFNHDEYDINDTNIYNSYEVPKDNQLVIFRMLKDRLNNYLDYLSEMTKMFWIEELALNPMSGAISKRTDFVFLPPDFKIKGSSRFWITYNDDFQTDLRLTSINALTQEIADEFIHTYIVRDVWIEYKNKAIRALYSSEYTDFIIYCAIEAESFIKKTVNYIRENKTEKDIVLDKLIDIGKNNFVDSYYKVILKYITGKILFEEEPKLYSILMSIYRLRNAIMHQGIIEVKDFKNAGMEGVQELNYDTCLDIYNKLQKAIRTTLNLLTPYI